MSPAHDGQLFILAFDHRGTLERGIFGIKDRPPTKTEEKEIGNAKAVIFDAFLSARDSVPDPSGLGILVDEQYGSEIAREAAGRGIQFAVAAEASGSPEFAFAYGDDFGAHIETLSPTYVKALVRYNPQGDLAVNQRSAGRLRQLCRWLADSTPRLLLEVVVPATPGQLAAVGGDIRRYDAELRPALMRGALEQLKGAGVEPAVWKVEGLERRDDHELLVAAGRQGGRIDARFLVLGRAASDDIVETWLRAAAPVGGYEGFAIGRTLWWTPLERHLAGQISREEAVAQIAARYSGMIEVYKSASAP